MSNTLIEKLRNQLVLHESIRYGVYDDGLGNPTVGVGFNLNRPDAPEKLRSVGAHYPSVRAGLSNLTRDQVFKLLDICIQESITEAKRIVTVFDSISEVRQRVIVDMIFQLGASKFSAWERLVGYLNTRQFDRASLAMARSLWFKQSGYRSIRLTAMMLCDVDLIPIMEDVALPVKRTSFGMKS